MQTEQSVDEDGFHSATTYPADCIFFMHAEAITIGEGHQALVSVEKLANQNLNIKMHDLKQM